MNASFLHLTVLDWLCVLTLGLFAFLGFRRGLIGEFFRIAAVLAGFTGAFALMHRLARMLLHVMPASWEKGATVAAFILLFVLFCGAAVLVGMVLSKIIRMTFLGWIDRTGGVLIGVLKGMLIIGFVIWMAALIPPLKGVMHVEKTNIAGKTMKAMGLVSTLAHKLNTSTPAGRPGT